MIDFMKLAAVCTLACASFAWFSPQESDEPKKSDEIQVPKQDPESISRRDFMRTKLMYSQNILEGLTTNDFEAIDTAIQNVQMITRGEKWVAIDNETFRRLTREFESSTQQLLEAAKTSNIDATALRFYDMSTRCIDCHKHVRKAGYRL